MNGKRAVLMRLKSDEVTKFVARSDRSRLTG